MTRDFERIERIRRGLQEAGMDGVVCAMPSNVLMLSGYWPVIGTSLVVATREGRVALIVPEDERELAARGWADEIQTFTPGSLQKIAGAFESVLAPLAEAASSLGLIEGRVLGFESAAMFEPSTYAAMHIYGASTHELLDRAIPSSSIVPADDLLSRLRSALTSAEIEHVRVACRIAEKAFLQGARQLRAGLRETQAAMLFRAPLSDAVSDEIARADGFAYCMSGANSAQAYAAYQRSRAKQLESGDFALVHCNSYADGFWTDITRTFCVGEPDERKRRMYEAVFAARRAALDAIRPGACAGEVDAAAREVMSAHGYGGGFKHGLGHGVGFAAINHNAPPRLHPASSDMLETGMVFNIEPAIYFDGYGGLRHCDVVAVTEGGVEILTAFQSCIEHLIIA